MLRLRALDVAFWSKFLVLYLNRSKCKSKIVQFVCGFFFIATGDSSYRGPAFAARAIAFVRFF